jgi:menaquinone-dependent protoporphyrinogen oxidase
MNKETRMSASILVGYATRYGSTREVAEAIAAALAGGGLAVDCRSLKEVQTLDGYGGVVLGAPLYMFRWHKDAKGFLSRHRQALIGRPVAVFALGPFNDVPKEWQDVRANLDKELAKFPWLAPVAIQVFGGKFDPAKLDFPYSLVPGLKKIPATDIRDWTAIRAWANSLAAKLQPDR